MSIKGVHIFLITCAIILSLGFGSWTLASGKAQESLSYQVLAALAFGGAAALILYLINVIKKLRSIV